MFCRTIHDFLICVSGVTEVGKESSAMNANVIPDAFTALVNISGTAFAKKVGVVCSAIRTSTIAPIISLVRTAELV